MSFRKPCHMPFPKLIPPFTLTGPELPTCDFASIDMHEQAIQVTAAS